MAGMFKTVGAAVRDALKTEAHRTADARVAELEQALGEARAQAASEAAENRRLRAELAAGVANFARTVSGILNGQTAGPRP